MEFVGAEHLIAILMVENRKKKISRAELNRFCICVRRLSVEKKTGVVFLTSYESICAAISDYPDYFQGTYEENKYGDNELSEIIINQNKDFDDLKVKFIICLPDVVIKILNNSMGMYGNLKMEVYGNEHKT